MYNCGTTRMHHIILYHISEHWPIRQKSCTPVGAYIIDVLLFLSIPDSGGVCGTGKFCAGERAAKADQTICMLRRRFLVVAINNVLCCSSEQSPHVGV